MSGRLISCAMWLAISLMSSTLYAAQQRCESLTAVLHPNAEPYDWLASETGLAQGVSVDLLKALAEKTQLNIQLIASKTAAKALREVRSGRVDLILGVQAQPEPDLRLDYMYPAYAQQDYRLWVRAGELLSLSQWPELSGLRGSMLEVDSLVEFARQAEAAGWPMQQVKSRQQALQMLLEGRADYFVAEQYQQQLYLQRLDQLERFEAVDPPLATQKLFVALAKDSACNDQAMRQTLSKALLALSQPELSEKRLASALQRRQVANPRTTSEIDE